MEKEKYISNNDIYEAINKSVLRHKSKFEALLNSEIYESLCGLLSEYKDAVIPALKQDILRNLESYLDSIHTINPDDYSVEMLTEF
jgi:glutamate synthase domain-containing protein 3